MIAALLAILLATQPPSAPTKDALVRAVLIHVRDATTSFDSEAASAPAPWFDSHYSTVFVACGTPPGTTVTPPEPVPCSLPKDLLGATTGARTLKAVPKQARTSSDVHAFRFYIESIDLHASTADVYVSFFYSSYFCAGTYHMRFHGGAWRVASAELGAIS